MIRQYKNLRLKKLIESESLENVIHYVWAYMVYPNVKPHREQYRERTQKGNFDQKSIDDSCRSRIAGDILLTYLHLSFYHPGFADLENALKIVAFRKSEKESTGTAPYDLVGKVWKECHLVAHLWVSYFSMLFTEKGCDSESNINLFNPPFDSKFIEFLCLAEKIRSECITPESKLNPGKRYSLLRYERLAILDLPEDYVLPKDIEQILEIRSEDIHREGLPLFKTKKNEFKWIRKAIEPHIPGYADLEDKYTGKKVDESSLFAPQIEGNAEIQRKFRGAKVSDLVFKDYCEDYIGVKHEGDTEYTQISPKHMGLFDPRNEKPHRTWKVLRLFIRRGGIIQSDYTQDQKQDLKRKLENSDNKKETLEKFGESVGMRIDVKSNKFEYRLDWEWIEVSKTYITRVRIALRSCFGINEKFIKDFDNKEKQYVANFKTFNYVENIEKSGQTSFYSGGKDTDPPKDESSPHKKYG